MKAHLTDPLKKEKVELNFLIHDDPKEFKKSLNHKVFYKWGNTEKYPATGYSKPGDPARERYELFIGGWLYYFDTEVRNREVDHAVYFEWDNPKGTITIWISPTSGKDGSVVYDSLPPPALGDPPKPKGPPPPY